MDGQPYRPVRLRQFAGLLALPFRLDDSPPAAGAAASADPGDRLARASAPVADNGDRYHAGTRSPRIVAMIAALITSAMILTITLDAEAQTRSRRQAMAAAIHPVADAVSMRHWLGRVPVTRDFPPDLGATLRAQAPLYVIEMTTAPGCLPCGNLWDQLQELRARHGIEVRTIAGPEAMLRSGRLGLPWVGHPVAWARPKADPDRMIPIAVGTDHAANLTRNLYLAAKMLTGVRPAVAVRAMSKFTGIVGAQPPVTRKR